MIYDKLSHVNQYKGISKWLDLALDFICQTDLKSLPNGRTEIEGTYVFANVMDAQARNASENAFEIHKNYMDIQIDLDGTEAIEIGEPIQEDCLNFNEETDFGTMECQKKVSCVLGEGVFIICMAGEPHKPGIAVGDQKQLRKCVIKVWAE